MISQNILNLVDTAMVGHVPEHANEALAGVNLASFVHFMAVAFITGLAGGVQAIASRRKGEGNEDRMADPLNGGLLIAVCLGIPLSIAFFFAAPWFFPLIDGDPLTTQLAIDYFQMRIIAMTFVGMNFAFRGYWNGVDLPKVYLRTLVVMHVLNVLLNWMLIYGNLGMPVMGSTGAAVGTAISTAVGTLLYTAQGLHLAKGSGFLQGLPTRAELKRMIRLALPTCLQQLFFAGGMTAFIVIVGTIGLQAKAAAAPLINLTLVGILPGMAFGMACATLVGQALGRGDREDASRWGWEVARLGSLVIFAMSLPALIFPDLILRPFLADAATRALAIPTLQLIAGTLFIDAFGQVLMAALIGAGATGRVMFVVIFTQWGVALPLAYLAGPVMGESLMVVWSTFILARALNSFVFTGIWRRKTWQDIKL
jgi:MATE family multidrug resistance protein